MQSPPLNPRRFLANPRVPVVILTAALGIFAAPPARGDDLVFPGIQPKVGAGAGQTTTRGGVAVFYNPANIIFSKFIEPYVDAGYAKITYAYQHVDTETYEPVTAPRTEIPVSAGIAFRPVPSFSVGFGFYTTGSTTEIQTFKNVPIPDAKTYKQVDVLQKQSGYKLGLGVAYRPDYPFAVGVGFVRSTETTQIVTLPQLPDDAEEDNRMPLSDASFGGPWNQVIAGVRSELFERTIAIALSYKTATKRTYAASSGICTGAGCDPDAEDYGYDLFEGAGYAPAVAGFGLEVRFGAFGAFVDFTHEFWAAGKEVYLSGLGSEPDGGFDFLDTNNIGAGIKFWVAPKHMLTAAFGLHGSNMGSGTVNETEAAALRAREAPAAKLADEGEDLTVGGAQLGSTEAIPRTIFAGGYRAKIQGNGYFEMGGQYVTGKREVPDGAVGPSAPGSYSLNVIVGSVGLAYGF